MRSPVIKHLVIFAVVFFVPAGYGLGQSNQCNCAKPPGGTVTCEKGQIPICIVKDGKITSLCKSPPPEEKTIAQQNAWLLSIILAKVLTAEELKNNAEYQRILVESRLETAQAIISFVPFSPSIDYLPSSIADAALSAAPAVRSLTHTIVSKRAVRLMPENHPENLEPNYRQGIELASAGRFAEAEAAFQRAELIALQHKSQRNLSDIYYDRALIWYDVGDYVKALGLLQKANEFHPGNADMVMTLVDIWYALGKYPEAERELNKAIRINSQDSESYALLGTLLIKRKAYAEAETTLRRAVMLNPSDAEVFSRLGVALYNQHKYVDAREAFIQVARLRPDNVSNYSNLGTTLYQLAKYAEAKDAFNLAIRLAPGRAIYYSDLGTTFYQLAKYAEAENSLRRAIQLSPEVALFHSELGRALYAQLKYSQAADAFTEATKLEPLQAKFHAGLGDALFAQQKLSEARLEYRKALAIDPQNIIYQQKLAREAVFNSSQ